MIYRRLTPFLLCWMAVSMLCQSSTQPDPARLLPSDTASAAKQVLWLEAGGLKLKSTIYSSAKLSDRPVLIVVLHGDLLGFRTIPTSTYHYVFAREAAMKIDDVVVAALLRPGYRDETGERSQGDQGMATGDNYTPEVVDAIARAIDQLKEKFHPAHTILVGHSGGAAITGDLLGRWPSTVNAALMVSCPCDLVAWRRHMQQMQDNNPIWSAPIRSLSPIDLAGKVPNSVRVRLLVGSGDDVAPPAYSERYADLLHEHGDDVTLTIAPGLPHDILLEPVTLDALAGIVRTIK